MCFLKSKFSIIEITFPQSDDIFEIDTELNINWESKNNTGKYVNIYYSLNNGLKWKKIESEVQNNGTYLWITPSLKRTIDKCIIKIRDSYNASTKSIMNKPFTIKIPDPDITIHRPMISESIFSGNIYNIEWSSISLTNKGVNIYLSIDEGYNWEKIGEFIYNKGVYNWDVPKFDSTQGLCQIMLQDAGKHQVVEVSDICTIEGYPDLSLDLNISDNEIISGGEQMINWKSKNLDSKLVNLFYSTDQGQNWVEIISDYPNQGNFLWKVPSVNKTYNKCRVKIELSDNNNIKDQSRDYFTLKLLNKYIKISNPKGDERITMGDEISIIWKSNDISEQGVNILYSLNGGKKYIILLIQK